MTKENVQVKERSLVQKRYTSKDCVIIDNISLYKNQLSLTDNVMMFFDKLFKINLNSGAIKAGRQLPKTPKKIVPPVIVEFVYFDHKNLVYGNRNFLAKPEKSHPDNFKPIFLREHFSRNDAQIREKEKLNLITTTYNSQVKVFVEVNGKTVSKGGLLISDIGRYKVTAI